MNRCNYHRWFVQGRPLTNGTWYECSECGITKPRIHKVQKMIKRIKCDWCNIDVVYDEALWTEEEAIRFHRLRKTNDPWFDFFCQYRHEPYLEKLEIDITTA